MQSKDTCFSMLDIFLFCKKIATRTVHRGVLALISTQGASCPRSLRHSTSTFPSSPTLVTPTCLWRFCSHCLPWFLLCRLPSLWRRPSRGSFRAYPQWCSLRQTCLETVSNTQNILFWDQTLAKLKTTLRKNAQDRKSRWSLCVCKQDVPCRQQAWCSHSVSQSQFRKKFSTAACGLHRTKRTWQPCHNLPDHRASKYWIACPVDHMNISHQKL